MISLNNLLRLAVLGVVLLTNMLFSAEFVAKFMSMCRKNFGNRKYV